MAQFELWVISTAMTVQLIVLASVLWGRIFRPRLGRLGVAAICLGMLMVAVAGIAVSQINHTVSVGAGVTVVLMTLITTMTAGRPQPAHPF